MSSTTKHSQRYWKNKFNEWRKKVILRLPEISTEIFKNHFNNDTLKRYGRCVHDLSNPHYGIIDENHRRIKESDFVIYDIMLREDVQQLFKNIYGTNKPQS